MPKITFQPSNTVVEVDPGTSVLDAALDNDVDVDTICGGNCICTACEILVIEGNANLSAMEEDELEMLSTQADEKGTPRLACQAKVFGDVIVEVLS